MKFATWDIETKGLAGDLVIGEILHDGNAHRFRKWEHFFNLLHIIPDGTTLYAHNGGRYDNRYVFDTFKKYGYKVRNKIVINGHILFTLYLSQDKKIYFKDSILLLKSGLKQLSIDFDVVHKKKSFDMQAWIKAGYPETDELREYLHYDCLSLKEILDQFIELVGEPKTTIAGTAFNILMNTEYKGKPIKEYTKNYLTKEDEDKIRLGYFGGRVEVFLRKCGQAFKYDVNSLYPWVMYDNYYPIGRYSHTTDADKLKTRIERYKHLGICKVKVKTPDNLEIPYLPVKKDGLLLFPLGTFTGWYTSIEILDALKLGYQFEYLEGYTWKRKAKLFKGFVGTYYKLKQTSKGAKKLMAKFLLNSSYGKFGQRRKNRVVKSLNEVIEAGEDIGDYEYINDELLLKDEESYRNRSINPVYAVFVTAYARRVLYRGLETVARLGGIVYYVDTDCIVCNVRLPPEMVHEDELGKWALEETLQEGYFIAPKLYKTLSIEGEHHVKAKGCTAEMRQELDLSKFKKLITGEGYEFRTKNSKVSGFFEHFRRLETDKEKSIGLITPKKNKTISGEYKKRELKEDGIKTSPIFIYD